jgi:sodium transport system permease protein
VTPARQRAAFVQSLRAAGVVFAKEWRDALRDRRTLLAVLLGSVALGPAVLVVLSLLVTGLEERAAARDVWVQGTAHAPSLVNFLERQTVRVREAPPDALRALRERRLDAPVLVVGPRFEAALASGEPAAVTLWVHGGDARVQAAAGRAGQLLQAFAQEQATLRLALRGVSPAGLDVLRVDAQDVADPSARAAPWMALLPFFVLMAVVYGTLNAALDTTAGERERGSLEPLLVNPVAPWALLLGKWAAVAGVGMLVAVLACAGFLPAPWLLRNETLAALFRFGPAEAALFVGLLMPLAALLAAALMSIAMACRSVREAQAGSTVFVLAVSLLPLVEMLDPGGAARWQLAVPVLSQVVLMSRVLRSEPPAGWELAVPTVSCMLLAALLLVALARRLARATAE